MTDVLKMLDHVYEAGADPALWPSVMAHLADALGAREAVLGGLALGQTPLFVAPRTDPVMVESYVAHYHAQNPVPAAMRGQGLNQVRSDDELTDIEAFRRSAFFNEWCVVQGFFHGAAVNVASGGILGTIMVNSVRALDTAELVAFQQVAPHLSRALRINQLLMESRAATLSAFSALDMTERAVFLVDAEGRISAGNTLAENLVGPGKSLVLSRGRLTCHAPADTVRLQRLVQQCLSGRLAQPNATLDIAREPNRAPLQLACLPVTDESGIQARAGSVRLMLIVSDPEERLRRKAERFGQAYRLTPAEAHVVLELAIGGDRSALAERLGISIATVRSQLTSIFDKTGVRRQAELVRLLMDQL